MSWFNKYSTTGILKWRKAEMLESSSQKSLFTTLKWRLAKKWQAEYAELVLLLPHDGGVKVV